MPLNSGLKTKARKSHAEQMFASRMRGMCQPKEREKLYDVVDKEKGSIITRAVPMEVILSYGEAIRNFTLKEVV